MKKEWPKEMEVDAPTGHAYPWMIVKVIPADLGRELYEALRCVVGTEAKSTLRLFGAKPVPIIPIREVLARYQCEVGS